MIVISPLNALIRDQIVKMRESGLSVCILIGDRVDTEDGGDEDISLEVPVEMLTSAHFDLIFTHPEGLVDKNKVSKSRNILKLENIRCESFCNVCYEKKDVWKECLEKGHISYVPSLRCWGHCLDNGLICTTFDSA